MIFGNIIFYVVFIIKVCNFLCGIYDEIIYLK